MRSHIQMAVAATGLLLLLTTIGCSLPDPTVEEASSLIRTSEMFSQPLTTTVTLPSCLVCQKGDLVRSHPELYSFLQNGLVTVRPSAVRFSLEFGEELALTPKGLSAASSWRSLPQGKDGAEGWVVPIAYKQLQGTVRVTASEATFAWTWLPNELGKVMEIPKTQMHAIASFRRHDDGRWHLTGIREISE